MLASYPSYSYMQVGTNGRPIQLNSVSYPYTCSGFSNPLIDITFFGGQVAKCLVISCHSNP